MTVQFNQLWSGADLPQWAKQPFRGFCLDNRQIQAERIFIALTSLSHPEKTRDYALQALEQGAIGVIAEQDLGLANVYVEPHIRHLMGQFSHDYLQATQPCDLARIAAVTGTNGKTTISRLIAELISLVGKRCAVMGTTGNGILPTLTPSTHTTLDALQIQHLLHQYSQQGAQFASLEASSHGLVQGRLNGCAIEVAVYSNLSRDHLDYHGTLEAYAEAKSRLFAFESLQVAVINADDAHAPVMLKAAQCNPATPKILTYGIESDADYRVSDIVYSLSGVHFNLHHAGRHYAVVSPLLGHFNIENLVASLIATAELLKMDLAELLPYLAKLHGAPGRMQVIRDEDRLFIVDYAHTPDALMQVLTTLKRHVTGQLWAVFGCGGDRDRGKRPLMTQAALAFANPVVLTSDNPRTEDPAQIFMDMKQGVDFSAHTYYEIHDRRAAIKFAIEQAKAGDIVLIAGKGHENYQEINGVRHWFDDVVEVQAALAAQHGNSDRAYEVK